MRWKQFFTPVKSINWEQAHQLVEDTSQEDVVYLDVRQTSEYNSGHMPGAKLLPLGDLDKKLSELDQKKHIVIY